MNRLSCILFILILLLPIFISTNIVKTEKIDENNLSIYSSEKYLKGYRYNIQAWIYLHIEGDPYERGSQHGYLLASEIVDMINRWSNGIHNYKLIKPFSRIFSEARYQKVSETWWDFCTKQCYNMYWDKFPDEYKQEMQGIADGVNTRGGKIHGRDVTYKDILTLNQMYEFYSKITRLSMGVHPLRTFFHQLQRIEPKVSEVKETDFIETFLNTPQAFHCNGFIATGDATTDGQLVFSHSTISHEYTWWWNYYITLRWNVILDVQPSEGNRVIMPSSPGLIWSDEDYYQNDNGIVLLETTNPQGLFDNKGLPLSVRARTAMQYGNSIDDVVYHLRYRNDGSMNAVWLIGDDKTGEIARFELGYSNYALFRTFNGFYWSANNPMDVKVRMEKFHVRDYLKSLINKILGFDNMAYDTIRYLPCPRDTKYEELGDYYYGKIDADIVKEIMLTQPIVSFITDVKVTDSNLLKQNGLWAYYGNPSRILNITNLDSKNREIKSVYPNGWVRVFGVPSKEDFRLVNNYEERKNYGSDDNIVWEFETTQDYPNDFSSASTIYNDTLYVSTSNGILYTINPENGEVIWEKEIGRNPTTPVINDDKIIIGHSEGLNTYDLDGIKIWEISSDNVLCKPLIIKDLVVFGDKTGNIFCVKTKNGEKVWDIKLDDEIYISQTDNDDYIIAASNNSCYKIRLDDQEVIWSYRTDGMITSSPVYSDDKVFLTSWDNHVYCVNIETGKTYWSYETGWGFDTSPVIKDDLVYVGCNDNNFYALDKKTGEIEWVYTCNAGIHSNPVVYGEYVFFGCDDGRFYALDKTNGKYKWCFTPGFSINQNDLYSFITTPIVSDPALYNDNIIFGANGTIYSLETQTYEEIQVLKDKEKEIPEIAILFFILSLAVVILITITYLIYSKKRM